MSNRKIVTEKWRGAWRKPASACMCSAQRGRWHGISTTCSGRSASPAGSIAADVAEPAGADHHGDGGVPAMDRTTLTAALKPLERRNWSREVERKTAASGAWN